MVDFELETPPISPLRLEKTDHALTCLTSAKTEAYFARCEQDWTLLFGQFGSEIKDNVDLRRKLNFDIFDSRGWTGLHAAVIMNDTDLVKVKARLIFIFFKSQAQTLCP